MSLNNLLNILKVYRLLSNYYIKVCLLPRKCGPEFLNSTQIFFGVGFGRSGTKFLAEFLNESIDGAYVMHEPCRLDFVAYQRSFLGRTDAHQYVRNFRSCDIARRMQGKDFKVYGEVNSVLRRHVRELKEAFPQAKIFFLARDGRDVVRSMLSRQAMRQGDGSTMLINRVGLDMWPANWSKLSVFEKSCWLWHVDIDQALRDVEKVVHLEHLVQDYEYFEQELLEWLDIYVSRGSWEQNVLNPRNSTATHTFPHWNDWSDFQRHTFSHICGDTMRSLEYDLTGWV